MLSQVRWSCDQIPALSNFPDWLAESDSSTPMYRVNTMCHFALCNIEQHFDVNMFTVNLQYFIDVWKKTR